MASRRVMVGAGLSLMAAGFTGCGSHPSLSGASSGLPDSNTSTSNVSEHPTNGPSASPVPPEQIHGVSAAEWNRADQITGLPAVASMPPGSEYLSWTAYATFTKKPQIQVLVGYSGCEKPDAVQAVESAAQVKVGVISKKPDPTSICPAIARQSIVEIPLSAPVGSRSVVGFTP